MTTTLVRGALYYSAQDDQYCKIVRVVGTSHGDVVELQWEITGDVGVGLPKQVEESLDFVASPGDWCGDVWCTRRCDGL